VVLGPDSNESFVVEGRHLDGRVTFGFMDQKTIESGYWEMAYQLP
jgi:hypothetical protein